MVNNKQCLHFSRHCSINRTLWFVISPPLTPIPVLSLFLLFVQWPSLSRKRKYRTLIPLTRTQCFESSYNKEGTLVTDFPCSDTNHNSVFLVVLLHQSEYEVTHSVFISIFVLHTHHYFKSFLPITLNKAKWPWPICHKKLAAVSFVICVFPQGPAKMHNEFFNLLFLNPNPMSSFSQPTHEQQVVLQVFNYY